MNAVTTGPSTDVVVQKSEDQVTGGLPAGYENQSLAVAFERAAIDSQIVTARAMPRQISKVIQNITTLATLDEDSAAECIYALSRAGKPIKGPSIRLAEIIASQWGNCRVAARPVYADRIEKYVEAEGIFHDLESNTQTTARVRRRISDKRGGILSEDMILVTSNAAQAIAKRNAILAGVPHGVWRKAYLAVEQVLTGDIKTLSERRDKALKAFAAFGVAPAQIFAALDVAGADDIGLEQLSVLIGMHSSLKNGEETVEELFPRTPTAGPQPKNLTGKLDQLAAHAGAEEVAPAAGPAADSGAGVQGGLSTPSPAAAAEPSPAPTADERKSLREYHRVLAGAMTPAGLSKLSAGFWKNSPPPEGSPILEGMKVILGEHGRRIADETTMGDVDLAVREWVAP